MPSAPPAFVSPRCVLIPAPVPASHVLSLTIPGSPVAKARPRLGKHGVYTPTATSTWETGLAWRARAALAGRAPVAGPVSLGVVAVHPRPERRPAHVSREEWETGARCPSVTKKDLSNIVKAVEDGLNHSGVWNDDNQVAHLEAWSYYAARDESPRVVIRVVALR